MSYEDLDYPILHLQEEYYLVQGDFCIEEDEIFMVRNIEDLLECETDAIMESYRELEK